PLQKIDILAAQLRDLQEEMAHLRSEKVEGAQLTLETTKQTNGQGTLHWKTNSTEGDTADKFEVCSNGAIRFFQAGRYLIHLTILHTNYQEYSCNCELQRDGICVKRCTATPGQYDQSPNFLFVASVLMKKDQKLAVVSKSRDYVRAQSAMLITLLK
ncbi:hypothetical protein Gpo141_00015221, partial [Globisporangium polare]